MTRHADRPQIVEEIHVDAPAEVIWPLVSDIGLPVRQSTELQAAEWADGVGGPVVSGRRFTGTNRNKYLGEWQTQSTVIECDPPRAFAWAVGDVDEPNSTWGFTVEPVAGGGCTVRQTARLGTGESGITYAIARMPDKESRIIERRLEDWRAGLKANLAAIKAAAEAG